jgi:pimeloyl-ACP methyl ester carboxylesterase
MRADFTLHPSSFRSGRNTVTTASQTWTEELLDLAGARIHQLRGGTGEPVLVLHDEMGFHGPLPAHHALAERFTLLIPSHPGFGRSERLDWIMSVRDLAGWYLQALDEAGIGPVHVIGFSMGAWLAAEMAALCPHVFKKLVLVSAMGVQPPEGEIYDMFLVTAREYIAACFKDQRRIEEYAPLYHADPLPPEQREAWEIAREQACRLAWRPYMFDPALPHLLRGIRRLPTLIVWGRDDAVVPLSAAELYHRRIPGSRLVLLDDCGHHPEVEQADQFVRLVGEFLASPPVSGFS